MPKVEECQEQIEGIRKLLGWDNPHQKDLLSKRNAEIATLLKDPEIIGSAAFKEFKYDYDMLANRAENITLGASGKHAKRDAFDVSAELRLLKKRVRLAAAAKDPVAATSTKKVQAELLSSLKREPEYRNQRERLVAIQKDLAGKPGTAADVKKLQAILDAAAACEPDYEKALEKTQWFEKEMGLVVTRYDDDGLQRFVRHADEHSRKFVEKAGGKDFQDELAKARQAVADYEKLAGISDGRGVAEANSSITAAVKLLDSAKPEAEKTKDLQTAKTSLQSVTSDLTKKITELGDIRKPLATLVVEVTKTVRKAVDAAPVEASVVILASHQAARALYENQQFQLAKDAWDELKLNAEATLRQYEDDYKQWQVYSKQIEAKRGILATASKQPGLSGAANYLQSLIDHNIGTDLIPAHKFGEACRLVESEKIVAGLDEITAQSKNPSNAQFTTPELEYRAEVAQGRQSLEVEFLLIDGQIKKLDQLGGDTSPFAGIRATFTKKWVDQTTAKEGQPKPDLVAIAQAIYKDCQTVKAELDQALNAGLDKSKADKKKAIEAAAFEKTRVPALAALRDLSEYNVPADDVRMTDRPTLQELETSYTALLRDADQGTYSPDKMGQIEFHCKNKVALIESDLKLMREEAAKTAKDLHSKIDEAEKANPKYKTFYAALRDEVDEAEGRTRSGLLPQARKGAADLKAVKLPTPDDYKEVAAKLKEVDTLLDKEDLKAYQPVERTILKKRLDSELKVRVEQLSPAEAKNQIAAFHAEITKKIERAGKLKAIHDKLEGRAAAVSADLETIKAGAPALYKSLKKRIKNVKKAEKGAVDQANLEMATLEILVKRAKTPGAGRDKLEKSAATDEFEEKRQRANFNGSMKLFQSGLRLEAQRRYDDTPACQRNKDVYKQIDEVVKQAKTMAKAKNFTGANQELMRAVNLTKYYLANPVDRATASNQHLLRLNQEYKAAVSAYLKQLSDLKAELKTAQEEDGTAIDTDDLRRKIIQPLFSLFASGQFDEPVSKLLKSPATFEELEEQRTWKEIALTDLRRFQQTLKSHKVLSHVIGNPIKPVSVTLLEKALRGLNGALQAS